MTMSRINQRDNKGYRGNNVSDSTSTLLKHTQTHTNAHAQFFFPYSIHSFLISFPLCFRLEANIRETYTRKFPFICNAAMYQTATERDTHTHTMLRMNRKYFVCPQTKRARARRRVLFFFFLCSFAQLLHRKTVLNSYFSTSTAAVLVL